MSSVTSTVAGERGTVGVGQLRQMSRICCYCWGENDTTACDIAFSFAAASTVPAQVLPSCAWLAIHFSTRQWDVWGPHRQTFCGEDKALLLLQFLREQQDRCG